MAELSEVLLATTNRGKARDFRRLLEGSGIDLVLPADRGLHLDVAETGASFEENALIKARAYAYEARVAVLADDSGLSVEALGGEPGIHSARYAGEPGDDHANNLKLIDCLHGVADRRAAFVCALALVLPDGGEVVSSGRCEGLIIDQERGVNGFGYDSLFFRPDLGLTFGEATPEQKSERSHRGAALRALLSELERRSLLPPGSQRRG